MSSCTFSKRQRHIAIATFGLVSFLVLILISGFVWIRQNEDLIRASCIEKIEGYTGGSCSLGQIRLAFSPWPTLLCKNFTLKNSDFSLSAAKIILTPSLSRLFLGELTLSYIHITDPLLSLALPEKTESGTQSFKLPQGCALEIENGSFSFNASDTSPYFKKLSLRGVDCYLHTAKGSQLEGDLFVRRAQFARANISFGVEDILLIGKISLKDFLESSSRLSIKATITGPDWLHSVHVQAIIGKSEGLWRAQTSLRGNFLKDEIPLPFTFSGLFTLNEDRKALLVTRSDFSLNGRDKGSLDCSLRFKEPLLEGTLALDHVSLTEWLGFARMLPPGLMHSLDHVTDARLVFQLDEKGLKVPEVSARCAGSRFTGRGGVESWAKPVVFLEMISDKVDLITAIPEAGANLVKEPEYTHGPLTPDGSTPSQSKEEGGVDVGYDIRLGAEDLMYGPLLIRKARVVIHPGAAHGGAEDIVLDAKASFYDGSFKGSLVLGGVRELNYAIQGQFAAVNGALLGRAMPVIPIRRGSWNASFSVTSAGRELEPFLRQLKGSAQAGCPQGELKLPGSGKNVVFTNCQLKLNPLRFGQWKGRQLGLEGAWKVILDMAGTNLAADLGGRVWFGSAQGKAGVEFQNLNTTLKVQTTDTAGPLPKGTLEAKGQLSYLQAQSCLRLTGAAIRLPGLEVAGQVDFLAQKELKLQVGGDFRLTDLQSLLSSFGSSSSVPEAVRRISGAARATISQHFLSISDINCITSLGRVRGSFGLDLGKKKTLMPNLILERLDLDAMNTKGSGPEKAQKLNWKGIENLHLSGSVKILQLVHSKLLVSNLTLPLELEGGELNSSKITGRIFGGDLLGRATLVFTHKCIELQSTGSLSSVNLTEVGRRTMEKGELSGRASLSGSIRAAFTSMKDWPACLWGQWSFRATEGRFQSLDKKKEPTGRPTFFSELTASGLMENGVLTSKNVSFTGENMKLAGRGELNLQKKTIDCAFDVDMKGLPHFPIYIEGTLEKTKTSVGAGALILNAIGSIFSGIVGIFR